MGRGPSSFCRVILSIFIMILFLRYEPLFKGLVFVSGLVTVPVTIHLEGGLESGNITDGTILVTSGMVILDDVVFQVSPAFGGFNESLNHIKTGSGKLNSTGIRLKKGYLMRLAADYIVNDTDTNTIHVVFSYGDNYDDSTAIWYNLSYRYNRARWSPIVFINATGTVTFSEDHVTISAQGSAVIQVWGRENLDGCLVAIRKEFLEQDEIVVSDQWWAGGWGDETHYYVAVPKDRMVTMHLTVAGRLAALVNMLDIISFYGRTGIQLNISCGMSNISIAKPVVERLSRSLEDFVSKEQDFFRKINFDVERYFSEFDYVSMLLRESESAFEKGDLEVGSGLFKKAIVKTEIALDALSQAKTDCIAMFLFSITFTFFLSSLVSMAIERKRVLVNIGLFTVLILAEIAFIPQVKMAVSLINPEAMTRLTSTSLALSLYVAFMTLLIVGLLLFEAKGTLLSDLFWYSVKSMRKRALRATLTIVTIAVVSAAAGSLLAVGTMTTIREVVYPSEFRGLSISSHVTAVYYRSTGGGMGSGGEGGFESVYTESFEPMPEWQVKWLSSMEGVERTYVVSSAQVFVSKGGRVERVKLVATNSSVLNGTMVSASLAEALDIKEGDSIIIIGENVVESRVDKILEEPLRLVDGVPLEEVEELLEIISGAPRARQEALLVVTGLELLSQPLSVYRLVLEGNFSSDFAKRLVEISYEKNTSFKVLAGENISLQYFRSFQVCLGTGSETRSLLIVGELQQFAGTPEIVVLMGLSSLMIITALLGSLYERQKEYSTITALGASPGRVSLLMFVEGLSYGLIGGALGYVLSQFLQAYFSNPVTPVQPYVFSSMLASFLVALVSSIIGSLIPARRVILKVVPSKSLFKKIEEVKLFKNHAEAMIPLRIVSDKDDFVTYVSSFTKRSALISEGPMYIQTSLLREGDMVKAVEMVLSYRGNRVAMYRVQLVLPEDPGSTVKALAYSASGEWGIDHKHCARRMLTSLREDLLQYVDWKKQMGKA